MSPHEPVVVAARRTPIGTRGRRLAHLRVEQLAAPVIGAAIADAAKATGRRVDVADVLLGNCMGPGGNPARLSALAAGLGIGVPGGTVDRQCGSGLAAVLDAATAIRSGDDRARIAGGGESASTAPTRAVDGVAYDRAPFTPAGWPDPDMVGAAQDLADADGIDRTRQDAHAARSHRRARTARDAGRFDAELVPLGGLASDDTIGVAEPVLRRLPPLIPGGSLTAATATRISDGAAAVVIVPRRLTGGAPGLAIRAGAVVGCDPALPGIGAALAVLDALASAGVGVDDVAAFEIVEAFAAQSLAVLDRLGIDEADPRVCGDGGALALGHPWGASGAVSMVRLFSRLVRAGAAAGTLGVAAASIGGGMGVAAVVEVIR
ncbi:acetyl-CoA acetyltransferase [Xylanimonas cellulosilytica DSM 15894]|uniref:Probable acetyl-CoA acetyltransferase n=1 Tax=Xylanimonas cellulosilytica (strain DSM 15894 / JCM 12276 / CECT 5975 / KCTC 9989 / LMG 20990 / NBRC 107835 / XIL07) TaxID=446471 RepID=D1BZU7_XYLCX|nr:thiolase family protein [Xylanimonas cellulosilytica]ACZ32075.1 acetyl-CoA acetyltransferase [Xylanimonas cellulosilytica DSM 15894]